MKSVRDNMIRPGMFGSVVAADTRRSVFDFHNEVLLHHQAQIDFLFIGDSITEMWDVETYFGGKGKRIVNRGISGDMTSYVLRRFLADVIQLNPVYTIIKIGVNNTWELDAARKDERKVSIDIHQEIVKDIREMVRLAKVAGIVPIVCSILPTCIETNKQTELRNELIIKINQDIKETMEAKGVIYVDYHSHIIDESRKSLRAELADDGLHPHVLGYNIMARVLQEELKKHGIEF